MHIRNYQSKTLLPIGLSTCGVRWGLNVSWHAMVMIPSCTLQEYFSMLMIPSLPSRGHASDWTKKKSNWIQRSFRAMTHLCNCGYSGESDTHRGNDEVFVIVRGKGKVFPWMSNVNMSKSIGSSSAVYSRWNLEKIIGQLNRENRSYLRKQTAR